MLLTIPSLLSETDLDEIRQAAGMLTWRDGTQTAGSSAARVKRNAQADLRTGAGRVLHARLLEAVRAHPVFAAAARPRRFSRLLLSRTGPGGGYGAHVDNAIMGKGSEALRADLSFTLFLSEPEAYTGGALQLDQPGMVQSLKPPAGSLVLYPTTAIHRVAPVTAGERLVCVGWIQSLVRDAAQRAVLFDLANLRVSLQRKVEPGGVELLTLDKTVSNLLRMWAEV